MAATLASGGRQEGRSRLRESVILRYMWEYRTPYLVGLLALLGASFFAMLPPIVLGRAIDAIDAGMDGTRTLTRGDLGRYIGAIVALALAESICRYGSRQLVSGTAYTLQYRLRNDLAAHLLTLDQRFYVESRTGDLMSRATQDLQWLRDFTGPTLIDVVRTVVMLILGIGFLLAIDVRLALISLFYFPIVAGGVAFFETEVERRYRHVTEQFGELANRVQESISGVRAVKAHALEEIELARFTRDNQQMMGHALRLARYTSGLFPVMTFASGLSLAFVLWFGGRDAVSGRISTGDFVRFSAYLALLASQLSSVGWTIASWQRGSVSLQRLNEVLRTVPRVRDIEAPRAPAQVRGEIEFRNVTVTYGTSEVLRGVDLHIPGGTTVAIVGGTGSGKTTLASLVPRLLDPVEGTVLVDGIDVREWPLRALRDAVGFVPQESFLFSDSLRENVTFGRPETTEADLAHALEASQLVNDIEQFNGGIDTVIGERGVTLSGGQRQRAALARALVKDPPILILDDALSHVDTHTEEAILAHLRVFMAHRTTLVIAHRTSTLRGADLIVALDGGRVAEVGTHEELIALGGVYARLYREQQRSERADSRGEDVEAAVLDAAIGEHDAGAGGSA